MRSVLGLASILALALAGCADRSLVEAPGLSVASAEPELHEPSSEERVTRRSVGPRRVRPSVEHASLPKRSPVQASPETGAEPATTGTTFEADAIANRAQIEADERQARRRDLIVRQALNGICSGC